MNRFQYFVLLVVVAPSVWVLLAGVLHGRVRRQADRRILPWLTGFLLLVGVLLQVAGLCLMVHSGPFLYHIVFMEQVEEQTREVCERLEAPFGPEERHQALRVFRVTIWNTLNRQQCSPDGIQSLILQFQSRLQGPVGPSQLFEMLDEINVVSSTDDQYFLGRYADLCSALGVDNGDVYDVLSEASEQVDPSGRMIVPGGFPGLRQVMFRGSQLVPSP